MRKETRIMSKDFVVLFGEFMKLIGMRVGEYIINTECIMVLSKVVAMANSADECCKASNAYFANLIHKTTRDISRIFTCLRLNELIYTYEHKPSPLETKTRCIYPNWRKLEELSGLKLPNYEIPEYVKDNPRNNLCQPTKKLESGNELSGVNHIKKFPPNNSKVIVCNSIYSKSESQDEDLKLPWESENDYLERMQSK